MENYNNIVVKVFIYAVCGVLLSLFGSMIFQVCVNQTWDINTNFFGVGLLCVLFGPVLIYFLYGRPEKINMNEYHQVNIDLKEQFPNIYKEVKYKYNTRNDLARLSLILNNGEQMEEIQPVIYQHNTNHKQFIVQPIPKNHICYPYELELEDAPVVGYNYLKNGNNDVVLQC